MYTISANQFVCKINKKSTCGTSVLLLLGGFALAQGQACADRVAIRNYVSVRYIRPYTGHHGDNTDANSEDNPSTKRSYAIMWVSQIPIARHREQLANDFGVSIIDLVDSRLPSDNLTYVVSYTGTIERMRDSLYNGFGPFCSLVEFTPEDKLSDKIANMSGFVHGCEIDTTTGYVYAGIICQNDVTTEVCDSIAAEIADSIPERYEGYVIMARPEKLHAAASIPQIKLIGEQYMLENPGCYNVTVRKTRMVSSEFIFDNSVEPLYTINGRLITKNRITKERRGLIVKASKGKARIWLIRPR